MDSSRQPAEPSAPAEAAARMAQVRDHLDARVIGQRDLVDRLLIALLADGHLLVEGAPGLAKTTAVKTLAESIEGDFHRVQFTPDLLPADLTGTEVYRPQDGSFAFQAGPIFHNVVLADEVNRAPAKVQSALLEAMGERQVTVGRQTYALPDLFLVMATQNPIEQEGTYPLPEAQLDRFLLHVLVDYPAADTEREILELARGEARAAAAGPRRKEREVGLRPLGQDEVFAARRAVLDVYISEELERYLLELVLATRSPQRYGPELERWIEYGASPRATIALDRVAKSHAWLQQRDYVSPEDIQVVLPDVLRHRIILSFEAEADGVQSAEVIAELMSRVAVP